MEKVIPAGNAQIFDKQNKDHEKMKADHEAKVENLYVKVGKLTTKLSWLKNSDIYSD